MMRLVAISIRLVRMNAGTRPVNRYIISNTMKLALKLLSNYGPQLEVLLLIIPWSSTGLKLIISISWNPALIDLGLELIGLRNCTMRGVNCPQRIAWFDLAESWLIIRSLLVSKNYLTAFIINRSINQIIIDPLIIKQRKRYNINKLR
jgi:hypothetical protein